MAVTNITYATTAGVTGSAVDSAASGVYVSWNQVDNTGATEQYVDVLVGGYITVGASWTTGETVDVYVVATYSDTDTDVGSAMDATGAIGTTSEVLTNGGASGEFVIENANFLTSVLTETASEGYHWGPVSLASAYGGTMPRKWTIIYHVNGTGALSTGNTLDYTGIEYTTA